MNQLHQALDIVNYINAAGNYHAFYRVSPHVSAIHISVYDSDENYQNEPRAFYVGYGYYSGALTESSPLQPMLDKLVQEFIL